MQEQKYSIKHWAKDDQPREKLLVHGAGHLSNSELLAILIHHGNKHRSAVDLAKDVLKLGKDNISNVARLSVKELMKIHGIGEAKAITISAALELGRRQSMQTLQKVSVTGSMDIANYLQARFKDYRHEIFAVVFLNRANKINHFEIVSEGGITGTVADPRIIMRKALEHDAVSIVLCHNHPSGNLRPSQADKELTNKIAQAATLFDIKVVDHVIVSDEGHFSFADEGYL